MKYINKLKRWIFKQCLIYIRYYNKDSGLVNHAISEFNITWKDWQTEELQNLMCEQVLDILYLLSSQGDSGSSIGYKQALLNKLIKFEPISKITFTDEDFHDDSFNKGHKQHNRLGSIFKENDVITCLNLSKIPKYYIGKDLEIIHKEVSYALTGQALLLMKNGSYKKLGSSLIIDPTKPFNNEKFSYPIYEIEYPSEWWITVAREQDLPVLPEGLSYDLSDATKYINKEIFQFEGGKHSDQIVERLRLVVKHCNK